MLDAAAVAAYRQRAAELREALAEAERWNDPARADRLREELDFLGAELGRAVGLGDRRRRAGSTSEKARVNVRRRVTHAIEKIAEHSPDLARHLTRAVKTGHFCAYRLLTS